MGSGAGRASRSQSQCLRGLSLQQDTPHLSPGMPEGSRSGCPGSNKGYLGGGGPRSGKEGLMSTPQTQPEHNSTVGPESEQSAPHHSLVGGVMYKVRLHV